MADPKDPEIKQGETLAFAQHAKTDIAPPAAMSSEQKAATVKAEQLKKFDAEKKGTEDRLKSNLGRDEFPQDARESLHAKLSGGEGTINATTGKAEFTVGSPKLGSKEHYERAGQIIDKISIVLDYTQIVRDAARDGKNIKDIYGGPPYGLTGMGMTAGEWATLRSAACDFMLQDGGIENKFSEELAGLTLPQKRAYIDAVLVTDPKLNQKIVEKMEEVQRKASEGLKPAQKSAERKKLEDRKTALADQFTKTYDLIIRSTGITDATKLSHIQDHIKPFLDAGATGSTIQREIYNASLIEDGITVAPTVIDEYQKAKLSVDELGKEIPAMKSEIDDLKDEITKTTDKKVKDSLDKRLRDLQRDLDQKGTQQKRDEAKVTNIESSTGKNTAWFDTSSARVKDLRSNLYGDETSPGISEYAGRLSVQQGDIIGIQAQIDELDATPDVATERSDRLAAETKIIADLEGVLPSSVEDLLVERHGELVRIGKARLDKAIEEAGKVGDKWKEDALKALKANMNTRWINLTGKNKKVDASQMRLDGRVLAEKGEEGAKEVFTQAAGWDEAKIKYEIGKKLGYNPDTHVYTDDETKHVKEVYDEQKKKLDQLYTDEGAGFKDRFFRDLFLARGLKQRLGDGDILNRNEWTLLGRNFADLIDSGIANSSSAKEAEQKLREAGIPMAPDSFPKWLLWALLGAVTLGKVGPVNYLRRSIS